MLDRIDKDILRLLLKYKTTRLPINEIATKLKISPRTAKKHLERLEEEYIYMLEEGKPREYKTKKQDKKNAKNKNTN